MVASIQVCAGARLVRLVVVGLVADVEAAAARRRPRQQLPAVLGDPEGRRDQRLGRRRAEADDHLGLEDGELRLQPRPAGAQVLGAGRLVDPALALRR